MQNFKPEELMPPKHGVLSIDVNSKISKFNIDFACFSTSKNVPNLTPFFIECLQDSSNNNLSKDTKDFLLNFIKLESFAGLIVYVFSTQSYVFFKAGETKACYGTLPKGIYVFS
jgi:hypothetical protein